MSLALQLARLRAGHAAVLEGGDLDLVARAALQLGRRLIEIQQPDASRAFVLAWTDGYEPAVGDDGISPRRLSPIPTLTFACCLGLCWPDLHAPPYPGEPTTIADVIRAATALGADDRHVKGALRSDLWAAGLIQLRSSELRLGPAVAAWAPAQVEALRRFHGSLPSAKEAEHV
jgi:hypothetical protein